VCVYVYTVHMCVHVAHAVEPHPILACEQLRLSGMLLLYPLMTFTCFQLTCSLVGCSKQGFLSVSQLPQYFVAPVQALLERITGIKFKSSQCLQKSKKFIGVNIKFCGSVVYSV